MKPTFAHFLYWIGFFVGGMFSLSLASKQKPARDLPKTGPIAARLFGALLLGYLLASILVDVRQNSLAEWPPLLDGVKDFKAILIGTMVTLGVSIEIHYFQTKVARRKGRCED